MPNKRLKKLFAKTNPTRLVLLDILDTLGVRAGILDVDQNLLLGDATAGAEHSAIQLNGETLGWVDSDRHSARIAAWIAQWAIKEADKNALAGEALDRYREINLLYNLSEKLTASLDLAQVAETALVQASRLIHAVAGAILLRDDDGTLRTVATSGTPAMSWSELVQRVLTSGKGEILNVDQTPPLDRIGDVGGALVCAPLKVKQTTTGVIALNGGATHAYIAADLKLLSTVAAQAAPPIESAVLYEKTLRQAREREEMLKRQIEELRIQIDEARTARQVAEITETDYFRALREKAERLRSGAGDVSSE